MKKHVTKRLQVHDRLYLLRQIQKLRVSAERTKIRLLEVAAAHDALSLLYQMRFSKIGCDPLDSNRPLNLMEQLNQTFTYAASFKAAKYLFDRHPKLRSLTLNLGTLSGWDIETDENGGIAAEVFAAVTPQNNDKLKEDIAKVTGAHAKYRYVFFMCPNIKPGLYQDCSLPVSAEVVSLGCDWM